MDSVNETLRIQNAAYALRMGLINWFQYFEIVRGVG